MPKVVDRDARRRELAAALWRVIRQQGVQHASVRAVAAESGWSTGAVRHYFATHDELLRFAVTVLMEDVPVRLGTLLADQGISAVTRSVRLVEQLLPLDEKRLGEVLVWLAFTDRARFDPALAHIRQGGWDGARYLARVVVADLAGRPRPGTVTEPLRLKRHEQRAASLHVLIDGLCLQAVSYPEQLPPAAVHELVEREIRSLAAQLVD